MPFSLENCQVGRLEPSPCSTHSVTFYVLIKVFSSGISYTCKLKLDAYFLFLEHV